MCSGEGEVITALYIIVFAVCILCMVGASPVTVVLAVLAAGLYLRRPTRTSESEQFVSDVSPPADVYVNLTNDEPLPTQHHVPMDHYSSDKFPYGSNPTYSTCYKPKLAESNRCMLNAEPGIDATNARMAALRARDKKVIDGAVTKTADYYRRHFSDELEKAEAKRWWGQNEY